MPTDPNPAGVGGGTPIAAGCLFALGSAMVTCLLLFINGVLLSTLLGVFADTGPPILKNQQVVQFVLFVTPVVLVILEWMMIDYGISRIRRRS